MQNHDRDNYTYPDPDDATEEDRMNWDDEVGRKLKQGCVGALTQEAGIV